MINIFLIIFIPILGALVIGIIPNKFKANLSVLLLGVVFILSVLAIFPVIAQKEIAYFKHVSKWFNPALVADGLSIFMAVVSLFVSLLISIFSLQYFKDPADRAYFYFWVVLCVGATMGIFFSANLILLYLFWEIVSICAWKLAGFYKKESDIQAAYKVFFVNLLGTILMLAGVILVYKAGGSLELSSLKDVPVSNLAVFLIFSGIIAKTAQIPLYSWLADASIAPAPAAGFLNTLVVANIGGYVFARIFCLSLTPPAEFFYLAAILGTAAVVLGAASAFVVTNMKRILAYSTISQLGYIILAFSLNTEISFIIGLIYILAHSLSKTGLFLCSAIIENKTGRDQINELGGLVKNMPLVALAYLLCAFSIIGIPPFIGFWPKFLVALSSIKEGHILLDAFTLLAALLTLAYLMRLYSRVFTGESKAVVADNKSSFMLAVVLVLGALSLLFGLGIKLPINFLNIFFG